MKKTWFEVTTKGINWGRMTVVFTILPALLNFMGFIWALVDGNWESGFIMAAMVAVCVTCTVLLWKNTGM